VRTVSVVTFLLCSVSIALVTPAFADDAPARPAFALMDNTGDGSKINLDVAAIGPTDGHADSGLFRSSILVQYVALNGFGGYAGISTSMLLPERDSGGDLDIGNLELGGLFRHALSPGFDLGLRVGFVVPTASGNDGGFLQLASTAIARPADLVTASPATTTWLRLGVSPTYHRGPVFLRTDLGVDVPVSGAQQANPIEHINLGAGIEHEGFAVTAELQAIFTTNGEFFKVAGLSARYLGNPVSPYVAVSTPLEDGLRGNVVTVATGLTFAF